MIIGITKLTVARVFSGAAILANMGAAAITPGGDNKVCGNSDKARCFGLGPKSPLTAKELGTCDQLFSGCKEPKWDTLISGSGPKSSIDDVACALDNLRRNELSNTGVAGMLHMERIVLELNDIVKTDASIKEIKDKITEIVEILTNLSNSPFEKSFLDALDTLNIPLIRVGYELNGRNIELQGTARYLSSAEAKTKLANQLTNALKPYRSRRFVQLDGSQLDMKKWFSDNDNERKEHKREIVTGLIDKAIEAARSQDPSSQIKSTMKVLTRELKKLLDISNRGDLLKAIKQLLDSDSGDVK